MVSRPQLVVLLWLAPAFCWCSAPPPEAPPAPSDSLVLTVLPAPTGSSGQAAEPVIDPAPSAQPAASGWVARAPVEPVFSGYPALPALPSHAGKCEQPRAMSAEERAAPGVLLAHLAVEPIRRAVLKVNPDFRACYQVGLQRDPSLSGRLTVQVKVRPDGVVCEASADGGFPDAWVAECVARSFYKLALPGVGKPVQITYPLVFSPTK